ncbi:MAG: hypothetical protein NVSMB29_12780 [Candidatus Dormibacteria bacterium]
MKIAVMGKGGSGKTTTSGVLARGLAREGWEVVAIDCDSNPNLGISLGLGIAATERLSAIRQALDDGAVEHAPTAEEAITRFGTTGPDRVRVAVVTKIDKPTSGCPCCGISPEQLLGELETGRRALIADMEAGMGTLTRMGAGALDVAVLIVEPTPKSVGVAKRAIQLIADSRIASTTVIVANKIRGEGDLAWLRAELEGTQLTVIPDDAAVRDADIAGISPLDAAPESPAVIALVNLAQRLSALAA